MSDVPCYGIHWDKGVAFLMQADGGDNAVGLRQTVPFRVKTVRRGATCSHNIPLTTAPKPSEADWKRFMEVVEDPVIQAHLPIPKRVGDGGVVLISQNDPAVEHLDTLSRMFSPVQSKVFPIWSAPTNTLMSTIDASNLHPVRLVGIIPRYTVLMQKVAEMTCYLNGKLVLVGTSDMVATPQIRRIQSTQDLSTVKDLPWENIGAEVARRHMRRQMELASE